MDAPARYFPFEKGLYEVAPLLRPFGMDFGNGALDQKIFQLDSAFSEFRQSKLSCRREKLERYYREHDFRPSTATGVHKLIIDRLLLEHPEHFRSEPAPDGGTVLYCGLTGDVLSFGPDFTLREGRPGREARSRSECPAPPYATALDALACQVAEDITVLQVEESGNNWLAAGHLCSPSSWRIEDKIGKDFYAIHSPVPRAEGLLKASPGIVRAMVHKGPYVRFVWGMTAYARPNHHPDGPGGPSVAEALGSGKPVYLWVERQVVWGCPEAGASLFAIRPYFTELSELRKDPKLRDALVSSLESMRPESRAYKGLGSCFEALIQGLL